MIMAYQLSISPMAYGLWGYDYEYYY